MARRRESSRQRRLVALEDKPGQPEMLAPENGAGRPHVLAPEDEAGRQEVVAREEDAGRPEVVAPEDKAGRPEVLAPANGREKTSPCSACCCGIGEKGRDKHERVSIESGIVTKNNQTAAHLKHPRPRTARGSLVVGGGPPSFPPPRSHVSWPRPSDFALRLAPLLLLLPPARVVGGGKIRSEFRI